MALHAWTYSPFIADDALISLRYARRLLQGRGLTWNDGEQVEGYSNLLWILLCSTFGYARVDLILATQILGLGASFTAIIAVVRAHSPENLAAVLPPLAASLALALSLPMAVWSMGGLEPPLLAGLLAWSLVLGYRLIPACFEGGRSRAQWLLPGTTLALLCWTRPDGMVFTAGVCIGLLAATGLHRTARELAAKLLLLPLLACTVQTVFRLLYYDDWLPNSARAKVAFTIGRLGDGFSHVGGGAWWLGGLILLASSILPAAWRDTTASRRARFLAAPALLWCAYVVAIGGDIFPGRRHLVPLVVILALIAAEGLRVLVCQGSRMQTASWGAAAVSLALLTWTQRIDPENSSVHGDRMVWDGEVVGKLLKIAFGEHRAVLATDAAGALPYFSELPSIDMLGINDRFLARQRPADFGWSEAIGHELGDGSYILDREPDLVVFCLPSGGAEPCYRGGREMIADPRFAARYRLVTFLGKEPYSFQSRIWVRAEGGRIGIRRDEDRVVVPAYLLTSDPGTVTELDSDGELVVNVTFFRSADALALPLRPGSWRMTAKVRGDPLILRVRPPGGSWKFARPTGAASFEVEVGERGALDVSLASGGKSSSVSEIVFEESMEGTDGHREMRAAPPAAPESSTNEEVPGGPGLAGSDGAQPPAREGGATQRSYALPDAG